MDTSTASPSGAPRVEAPRPRGRWKRRLLLGLLGLGLLILIAPYAGAPFLRDAVVGALEDQLDAHAALRDLSFSWPGELHLQGLELRDPENELLVSVEDVRASVELLPLLGGRVRAELSVLDPELHVSRAPDGRWNWERARSESRAAKESQPEAPTDERLEAPDLHARVLIEEGRVVVHGPGAETRLEKLTFQLDVAGLDRPASFSFGVDVRGPGGPAGSVALHGAFTAAAEGVIDVGTCTGTAELELTDLDLAGLAPALALAAPVQGVAGVAGGKVELELGRGLALRGTSALTLRELVVAGPRAGEPLRVARIGLDGTATLAENGEGTQHLELAADDFLTVAYDGSSRLSPAGEGQLGGSLTVAGDLARLSELARPWAPLQEGVRIQGRLAHKVDLSARLSAFAPTTFDLSLVGGLSEVAAHDAQGRAIELGELASVALELEARGNLAEGALQVEKLSLGAGPLALRASCLVAGASASASEGLRLRQAAFSAEADLERLRGTLATLVDLSDLPFGGRLSASGTLGGEPTNLTGEGRVEGRALVLGDTALDTLDGEFRGRWTKTGLDGSGTLRLGALTLARPDGEPLRVPGLTLGGTLQQGTAGKGTLGLNLQTADGGLKLIVQGESDLPGFPGTLTGDARFSYKLDGRIERLASLLGPLLAGAGAPSGDLRGQGEVRAVLEDGALARASGKLEIFVAGLGVRDAGGQALALGGLAQSALVVEGDLDGALGAFELRSLTLTAGALRARAKGKVVGLVGAAALPALDSGELALDADLEALGRDLAALVDLGGARLGGGKLALELTLAARAERLEAKGTLRADALRLARAEGPPLEQRELAADFDLALDPKAGSLAVRRAHLASQSGSLEITGTLEELATPERARADLRLTAAGELERLLADFSPQPPGRSMSGKLGADFELTGDQGAFRAEGTATIEGFRLEVAAAPAEPAAQRKPDTGGAAQAAPLVIEDAKIALGCAAAIELAPGSIDVEKFTLDSGLVRGGAKGKVRGLALGPAPTLPAGEERAPSELVFEGCTGEFAYVPDRLGAVLAPWLPGRWSGAKEERATFSFSGRASELDLPALLAGTDGRIELGLEHLVRPEIELGGTLALEAKDGRTLVKGDLLANGGTLQVDGALALDGKAGETSQLSLQAKDLRANSGLAPLLAYVHPAFAGANLAQGQLDGLIGASLDLRYEGPLTLAALEKGWDALPKEPIHGQGRLEVRSASLKGSPLLAALKEFGVDAEKELDLHPIEFTIQRGRVTYAKPWTWMLSGTETTFTGSVGLDQTLDLAWNLPISDALVKRWGFLESLRGQLLTIPLRGTVSHPKLEADDMLKELAAKAAKNELGSRLGLGGGAADEDPAKLLQQADKLWDSGKKAEAAKIYGRLREEFKLSLVYALNKDRIKDRAKFTAPK